jgi:phosphatidate cytidylyltransferase
MTPQTLRRLFGAGHAFDEPVTLWITLGVLAALIIAPIIILIVSWFGLIPTVQRAELFKRYFSWLVLVPMMGIPVLLGAAWMIAAVFVLSLACFNEYARATGLFRERLISLVVVFGIVAEMFAVADHWYDLFVALFPLTVGVIAATGIVPDRPKGYIQRVALGVLGYALFGSALGHLGYMANETKYRPIVLLVLVAVAANDIFAYITGRMFGRRKLAPNTSPNKTVGGALGALVLTTALVTTLGHFVFLGEQVLDNWLPLITLGVIISVVGQLGDLMLSSIKRDLGIKDTGTLLPGHGGLLDRFDSLIMVSPAVFHFVGYFVGFGWYEQTRIISGGYGP